MVIAHRGYSRVAKENTLSAFDAAIKAGAKGIECDVRLTKDKKAIIYHNNHINLQSQKIKISKYTMDQLRDICKHEGHELLVLDELFDYMKQKQTQFFLEIKTSSTSLTESLTKKIKEQNLWEQVNIMGWSFIVRNALRAQAQHPKLQVGQFLHLPPAYRYMRKPKKSYCVFLGWLDGIPGSQRLFRTLISPERLANLKTFLERQGFNVKAGVINNDEGLDLFAKAGITDIVTDRVAETVKYFKGRD
ncbi:MAG: glycerophosphodiester phosphodiesterase family protein [Candidatus Levybacteria bacterium]|nr:glycerophosphodiester phosphodiesterase family protein [Candidatus Levybacteria bacterium]